MEREHGTGAVLLVGIVGEARQLPRRLIRKADAVIDAHILEGAACIAPGLRLDGGNVLPLIVALRFDYANRLAVHEKRIVHRPGAGGILPHRDTGRRHRIDLAHILYDPAGLLQPLVDCLPRFRLGCHVPHLRSFYNNPLL